MWHQLEATLSDSLNLNFVIKDKRSISGGDISQAYLISDGTFQFFVKVNKTQFIDNFNCEAHALSTIEHTDSISCPKVICVEQSKAHSFLVLNYLNFDDQQGCDWEKAGKKLAKMHLNSAQAMFGFEDDNYIGNTLQPNKWHKNWASFFSEQRIGYQLKLLADKGIRLGDIDEIVAVIHNLLKPRKAQACLLHGDLWRGNIGFHQQQPFIYDPASYYGDNEVDLAMTELFGTFPDEFYLGYYSKIPESAGYHQRKEIYNFYHILNHVNLFGDSYLNQAKSMLKCIAQF